MARAMKKSLHTAFHQAGWKAFALEEIHDLVMNVISACAIPDSMEGDFLSLRDAVIGMFQSFRSSAPHNRPRDVAEVAGPLRTRKDIHDDRRVRANGPSALIMRIDALI